MGVLELKVLTLTIRRTNVLLIHVATISITIIYNNISINILNNRIGENMYEEMNEIFLITTSPLIDYLILGAVGLVILWWVDANRK
jgi:hypothetical protein